MHILLSNNAIKELKISLQKSYGVDFVNSLSEQEINDIGSLLLNILAENLKMKM